MNFFNKKALCEIVFLLLTALAFCQNKENHFELRGNIHGIDTGTIYLAYYNAEQRVPINDSTPVKQGAFFFAGSVKGPTVAFISLERNVAVGLNSADIFIEPAIMNINVEFNNFQETHLTGSIEQGKYETLRNKKTQLTENHKQELEKLNDEFTEDDFLIRESLSPYFDSLNQIDYNFFDANPTSYLTLYLLQYHLEDLSHDSLALFYNRLGGLMQRHIIGERIAKILSLKGKDKGAVGTVAPHFIAMDNKKKVINSEMYRGKYLLIDFWASWCIPCRKNSPHLVALYRKYKARGLNIVGIADDHEIEKWEKAIKADKINLWPQIRRVVEKNKKLSGVTDENDINESFGVHVLPVLILIDTSGVIIARFEENMHELEKVLDRLL